MSISAIADKITEESGRKCSYQQVYNVLKYSKDLKDQKEVEKARAVRIEPRATPTISSNTIQEINPGELEEEEDEKEYDEQT